MNHVITTVPNIAPVPRPLHKSLHQPLSQITKHRTIKPVFRCQPPVDKNDFQHASCLLTISVGQEVHEGDKFEATIDLVNASFGACTLLIDDSLQRHSMALDKQQNADFFGSMKFRVGNLS